MILHVRVRGFVSWAFLGIGGAGGGGRGGGTCVLFVTTRTRGQQEAASATAAAVLLELIRHERVQVELVHETVELHAGVSGCRTSVCATAGVLEVEEIV